MIIVQDESGVPLPPGVMVTLYPYRADPPKHLIVERFMLGQSILGGGDLLGVNTPAPDPNADAQTGYTQIGGIVSGLSLEPAVAYTATFDSPIGPRLAQPFVMGSTPGSATIVPVIGYRSPFLDQDGYTREQILRWVKGWFSEAASSPGGVPYAVARAFAYALALVDSNAQTLLSALRGQTAQGSALDSFIADFFGQFLPRYIGESDAIYWSRAVALMSGLRGSRKALGEIITQYYLATETQRYQQALQLLAYDSFGGFDERGGFDIWPQPDAPTLPVIAVWDSQSSPNLAALYSIEASQFVIQIGFTGGLSAWGLDYDALDFEAVLIDGQDVQFSTTAPEPALGALVDFVKDVGYEAIYCTYVAS